MNGLDEQKTPRQLWVYAAVIALALHAGGAALAIAQLQVGEDEDSLGAPAIEVGLELTSANADPTDLPPGPESDAVAPSPQVADQRAEVKETDLPQDKPTEAEDADRIVSRNESKKPKEDDPKIAAVQTQASPESDAHEATAAPRLDAPRAAATKAPKQGIGNSAQLAKVSWEKKLMAHFKKHLIFPEGEQLKGSKIVVTLDLEFDRIGHVVSASIVEGSGRVPFDEAALKMIRRSDPVPVPPPLVADQGLKRTLPVVFNEEKSK